MNYSIKNEYIELKNVKYCVELYLRALWGKTFRLECLESEYDAPYRYLDGNRISLPEKISLNKKQNNYYRASAVHASLHNIYSNVTFEKNI